MPDESASCKWQSNHPAPIVREKISLSQAVTASLSAYCYKSLVSCNGTNIGHIDINLKFLESLCARSKYKMGETEFVSLPYHNDFLTKEDKYGNYYYSHPDELFPWEGVANVAYAETGDLHPLNYKPKSPEALYFADHWIGEAAGLMQTTINRFKTRPCNSGYTSPNDVALTAPGQYRWAQQDVNDPVYKEIYALAFVVVQLKIRVHQPYCNFTHQDRWEIRGSSTGPDDPNNITNYTDTVAFGPGFTGHTFYITKLYPSVPSNQ